MKKSYCLLLFLSIISWNSITSQTYNAVSKTKYVKIAPVDIQTYIVTATSGHNNVRIQRKESIVSEIIIVQNDSEIGFVNIIPLENSNTSILAQVPDKENQDKIKPKKEQIVQEQDTEKTELTPKETLTETDNKVEHPTVVYIEPVKPEVDDKVVTSKDNEILVSEAESNKANKNIIKFPYLIVEDGSIKFSDDNKNNSIDAGENASISFILKNTGEGTANDVKVTIQEKNSVANLKFENILALGEMNSGEAQKISIRISANTSLKTGKALFELQIDEKNGFEPDPVMVEVITKSYSTPFVKIVDYSTTSNEGTSIQKRQPFEVNVLVQNIAGGTAENIIVSLDIPDNMFCLSANNEVSIQQLGPGASEVIQYTFVTNNNYASNEIPLQFYLNEKYNKYASDSLIVIHINQAVLHEKLVVKADDPNDDVINIGSLSSSIDKDIPLNDYTHPNRIALVIGNQDYSGLLNSEINVDFARNDAEIVKKYFSYTMGVEERNMFFLLDATAGEMRKHIDLVAKLAEKMGKDTEILFYYAGHGIPDEIDYTPYIIPTDVDATNLASAIKLSDLYNKLAGTGVKKVVVILDACFTGGARKQGLLAARAVKVKPKKELISGNMIVFSASSGEQSALAYEDEGHGMFTYFLLKRIKDTKGDITYGELADYVTKNVSLESLRINHKEQDPEVNVSQKIVNKWRSWVIK